MLQHSDMRPRLPAFCLVLRKARQIQAERQALRDRMTLDIDSWIGLYPLEFSAIRLITGNGMVMGPMLKRELE